jgi:phosphopantetheinyl transferase (holo-ACP synthase)
MEAWSFREVEVGVPLTHGGVPEVRLSGAVADRAAALGVSVSVSLTHTRREAAAVAIAA